MSDDAREMETRGRFEVRGYFYRFNVGIDEAVFECERCGALVGKISLEKHDNFHAKFSVIEASTV